MWNQSFLSSGDLISQMWLLRRELGSVALNRMAGDREVAKPSLLPQLPSGIADSSRTFS